MLGLKSDSIVFFSAAFQAALKNYNSIYYLFCYKTGNYKNIFFLFYFNEIGTKIDYK